MMLRLKKMLTMAIVLGLVASAALFSCGKSATTADENAATEHPADSTAAEHPADADSTEHPEDGE
jgi:hypothetical protein